MFIHRCCVVETHAAEPLCILCAPLKTGYHPAYDCTFVGPNPRDLGPPDGMIPIGDIVYVLNQYGQDCA